MKFTFSILAILLFAVNLCAQSRTISKDEYERVFNYAVAETNKDFPFVFEVVTTLFENGKPTHTLMERNERESPGHERTKKTEIAGGRETTQYQIKVGLGNVFCSDDGISWKSSKYECGSKMIFGLRPPESVEYSVSEKQIENKPFKIYREYSIFASDDGSNKRYFTEKISTIDSRGFFISIEDAEGSIDPKTITLTRRQTWTKAKIEPIVAPTTK